MPDIITPRPGFDWSLVNWGGPDQPRTEHCSYCGDEIPEDSVPLILWNAEGWCAEFCDHCQATWWGIESFDEPAEPRHEPEVERPFASLFPDLEPPIGDVRSCRICSCTDARACPGGCYWVEADLSSACATRGPLTK